MGDRSEKLYGGQVTLEFDDKLHAYRKDNYLVPGVTTILKRLNKPALMPWAAKMTSEYVKKNAVEGMSLKEIKQLADEAKGAYRRFTDEAADIGTIVHNYAENRLKGLPVEEPDNEAAQNGVKAFNDWLSQHDIKCYASERMIFSREMFYAGTADFYGTIDGELVIADLKTSSGIWNEYWIQTSAYQLAIEEEDNVEIDARWIIRLDKKTGKFEAKRLPHSDAHCDAWKALRILHGHLTHMEQELGK